MTAFSIEIVSTDDRVVLRFSDDHSIVITPSSDGVIFSPTATDRHLTWTDTDEGVPYPHVTDESTGKMVAAARYDSIEDFNTEMYAGMLGVGDARPINWLDGDHLWELDSTAYGDLLEEHGVMERSEDRLWIGLDRLEAYLKYLNAHEEELEAFLNRVYRPVDFAEAAESDGRLFFTEMLDAMVLKRPDGYVVEMPMNEPSNLFEGFRRVRTFDVMFQMFDDSKLSNMFSN